jgi:hypothetical protein
LTEGFHLNIHDILPVSQTHSGSPANWLHRRIPY